MYYLLGKYFINYKTEYFFVFKMIVYQINTWNKIFCRHNGSWSRQFFRSIPAQLCQPKVQGQDVHRVHGGSPEQDPAAQWGEEGRGEKDGEEETVEDGPGGSRVPIWNIRPEVWVGLAEPRFVTLNWIVCYKGLKFYLLLFYFVSYAVNCIGLLYFAF